MRWPFLCLVPPNLIKASYLYFQLETECLAIFLGAALFEFVYFLEADFVKDYCFIFPSCLTIESLPYLNLSRASFICLNHIVLSGCLVLRQVKVFIYTPGKHQSVKYQLWLAILQSSMAVYNATQSGRGFKSLASSCSMAICSLHVSAA